MMGLQNAILFIMVFVAMGTARAQTREKRIVGGSQYDKGDYPFHVSLWFNSENNFWVQNLTGIHHACGGSLIGDRWVLTAAQCFDDDIFFGSSNVSNWDVAIGLYGQRDWEEDEVQFRGIEQYFLADYDLRLYYGDVAVVKLDAPVDLSRDNVEIVKLNKDRMCPHDGQTCTLIGWGDTIEPLDLRSSIVEYPRKVDVDIVNVLECADRYTFKEMFDYLLGPFRFGQGTMCAGHPQGGADGCFGDHGSPLLCKCPVGYNPDRDGDGIADAKSTDAYVVDEGELVVVGLWSFSAGCGRPGYPGIYMTISYYVHWIEGIINANQ